MTEIAKQKHPVPPDQYTALVDRVLAEYYAAERRRLFWRLFWRGFLLGLLFWIAVFEALILL